MFAEGLTLDFLLVLVMGGFSYYVFWRMRTSAKLPPLRRIAGLDAIEEAVGRATEMDRPVLYLPGYGDFSSPELLASMAVLAGVSRMAAKYETRLLLAVDLARVHPVIQEIVRQGYIAEGKADLYRPEDVRWFSDFWSGHSIGVIGTMLREKVAANIMLGAFYANSLMFAETGNQVGAIQVGGTASVPQIPFFVAACDYALIGEELYAAAAYISRDPVRVSSIVAQDWAKFLVTGLIILGTVLSSTGSEQWLRDLLNR